MIQETPVGRHHFVRISVLGHVGRFTSVDAVTYGRGMRVICRTSRGLEVGEILSPASEAESHDSDGSILRGVTVEDDLLIARLERNRQEAFAACQQELASRGIQVPLLEVEQLFDGSSLYFYFLGDVPAEVADLTSQLAETYNAAAGISQFSDLLETGCGPGCGTAEKAGGCGGACTSCAIAGACKK
ncbi:PSP1 C-terminal domain-containing protein [Bremerella sp. JC817]|uniref:PSP1 C-terminal domain-containing protein n=1 Tax=Bremerella sp. JC817 TaxID=3231756 RepID=UPI0034598933